MDKKPEPLLVEQTFDAPFEKVWKVITEKDHLKNWYFDLDEFIPEIGFKFRFYGGEEGKQYLHVCEITEVIPFKMLKYSWRYEGYEGSSYVTFTLYGESGKTRLQLKHEGLETFPQDNDAFVRENFEKGWDWIINKSLAEYIHQFN